MATVVFGLVVGWQLLTFGLGKPVLNHLAGATEDLSQFADLPGCAVLQLPAAALPHPVGADPGLRLQQHPGDRHLLPHRTDLRALVASKDPIELIVR
ncbi:MAG TPA: hypothetical protein VF468_28130 [Actinomycetota bacterium]|nr:hypothetical protein [Actinomycetota bacterium]